jgi:hypothetical protein
LKPARGRKPEGRAAKRSRAKAAGRGRPRPYTARVVICACLASGCFAPQPILYPNATWRTNGEPQADRDVAECAELAEQAKATPESGGAIAGRTAEDAAAGGAAGAAGGAVFGNPGTGAAAGAAAGAAHGLIHALFSAHRNPAPAYRAFVERCLAERGYEVVGWE